MPNFEDNDDDFVQHAPGQPVVNQGRILKNYIARGRFANRQAALTLCQQNTPQHVLQRKHTNRAGKYGK